MFPPNPIECFLPPFPNPWHSHNMNMYLIWIGSNWYWFSNKLNAIAIPILASSVHVVISPCLVLSFLYLIALYTSEKPFLIIPCPYFLYSKNSVQAPKASQITIPKNEPIPRDYFRVNPS